MPSEYTCTDIEVGGRTVLTEVELMHSNRGQGEYQYVTIPCEAAETTTASTTLVAPENLATAVVLVQPSKDSQEHNIFQSCATSPSDTHVVAVLAPSNEEAPLPKTATDIVDHADNADVFVPQQQVWQQERISLKIYTGRPTKVAICPYCGTTDMTTRTHNSPDFVTFLLMFILSCICCPLCFLPLCIKRCKRTKHYCSTCNAELAEIPSLTDCGESQE